MELELILAWVPIAAAAVSALGSMAGGMMSSAGAAGANAQNIAMQNQANQMNANIEMAKHAQNTAFMEDQQAFNREERQYAEIFNAQQADLARQFSSQEAGAQRNFQEYMAGTAYRRAMIDMKAAGLNPILAYQQGGATAMPGAMGSSSSASSPGASSGTMSASSSGTARAANVLNDKEAIGRAIGNMANSAVDAMRTYQGIDLMKEQESLTRQKEAESKASEENIRQDTKRKVEETRKTAGEADNTTAAGELMRANATSAAARAAVDAHASRVYGQYDSPTAPNFWERLGRILQHAVESGQVPRAAQPIVNQLPAAPSSSTPSDFWGTSDRIKQRAEENRRRYGQ